MKDFFLIFKILIRAAEIHSEYEKKSNPVKAHQLNNPSEEALII